ncbi:MAG: hypothetical protein V3R25_10180 [Nitrosomonadaceae bacterium]
MRVIDKRYPRTGIAKADELGVFNWVTWHGGDIEFVHASHIIKSPLPTVKTGPDV